MNSREVTLQILMKMEKGDLFSNILLNEELNKSELSEIDKTFVTQLFYGIITNRIAIDFIIRKSSKIRFNKIAVPILNIIRMGIYQIYFLDKIPVSAACNEAVKLAKKYGHASSAGFVNAILRNASRNPFDSFFSEIKGTERISLMYSYPEWLIKLFVSQFGEADTKLLLDKNNEVPKQCVRVNELRGDREELIEKLDKLGISSEKGLLDDTLYVDNSRELLHTDLFEKGFLTFQDEAPALVAHLAAPKEGDEVLDICAAPGGKTTHLAQLANDKCKITAMELYVHRGKLIEETAKRLGVSSIKVKIGDATKFIPEFEGKFDEIVADVPCSGLGVIRKKPDIKLRIKEEDIEEINNVQKAILDNAAKYLKIGGRLVYSTCTIIAKENQDTVNGFLKNHKNFKIITDEAIIPAEWENGISDGMLTLLPHKHNCDGFFICVLTKID